MVITKRERSIIQTLFNNVDIIMSAPIKVQFLSAEADPLAKVGGLGDVAGSLPAVFKTLANPPDVRVALPFYPFLKKAGLDLSPIASFEIAHHDGPLISEVFETTISGVPFYLIDGPPIAKDPAIYSGNNRQDGSKFCFYSLAAMELNKILKWQPDLIHAHDWHASPAVYNLRLIRDHDPFYKDTKSLLTVHNLPYLGYDTEKSLLAYGLPRAHLSSLPNWAEHLPLPLGLLTADKINTVSPGYADEMFTPEFGANLENFLKTRKDDLVGILNGINMVSWDPGSDPDLDHNFSFSTLQNRKKNKELLLEELGLDIDPDIPLIAMINRLDHQKGVDLVPEALRMIPDQKWQAILLGTGDPVLEKQALDLDHDFTQVRSVIKFDGSLARRIYGGSDLIMIPSRYEPCGLTQMIGMRYGCVPLARSTGGLKDTIIDYHSADQKNSTGFLFEDATSTALAKTIRRALELYQDQRRWQGLQRRGMKKDFSWKKSAQKYLGLYADLIKR